MAPESGLTPSAPFAKPPPHGRSTTMYGSPTLCTRPSVNARPRGAFCAWRAAAINVVAAGVKAAGVNLLVRPPKSPDPFGSIRTQSPSNARRLVSGPAGRCAAVNRTDTTIAAATPVVTRTDVKYLRDIKGLTYFPDSGVNGAGSPMNAERTSSYGLHGKANSAS